MSDFILTPAPGSRSTCALGPFPDATAAEKYAIEHRLVGHYRPFPLCLVEQPADDLAEQGRKLASARDDLIAQGFDPADLIMPLYPSGARP